MNNNEYRVGVNRGLPVGMGYFSVSFGFGAMAVSQGVKTLDAVLISAANLTSAGQFAGLTLIVAAATLWEMVLTQLVINSRYALMSLALSQRMGEKIGLLPRLLIAFFNTDEIFALAMAREAPLTVPFLLGLGTLPFIGWTLGTLCGALAGSILPLSIRTALGVMLYGMFIAIVVPPAKKNRDIFVAVVLALIFSSLFSWTPGLKTVSPGLSIVVCTVAAAAICAALGLTGLAGGAAVAGCCAQMIGFAVMSFPENRWGGLAAQGLGTSMLQMGNIVRNVRIWIPPTLASAVTGPIATCLFKLQMNGSPVSSGMGTCGFVGQIGVYTGWLNGIASGTKAAITGFDWLGLILISFVLPAVLTWLFAIPLRNWGWIKDGDLKLDL